MNSEIKIIDNFLERKDFQKIVSVNPAWNLQTSNPVKGELPFLYSDLTDESFFNSYLYDKVVEQLDGDNYRLQRVYFNGQRNGREGTLHSDGCDFTLLI